MHFQEFKQHIKNLSPKLRQYTSKDAPRVAGIEAVNHFKQSFQNEGFIDSYLEKWKKSQRTNPDSKWYGFLAGAKTPKPNNHPSRNGTKKPYKARKESPVTNYSPAATKRKTLIGASGDLSNSIEYRIAPRKAFIFSNLPYARVHNEGGTVRVFGRKTVKLPKRQFIGDSKVLDTKIKKALSKDIERILNI